MKHFLTKIIQGDIEQSAQSVHRRFVKFSRGSFPNGGPVLRATTSKKKNLTLNGSFEYEDIVGYFVATHMPEAPCKIGGNIFTQPRVKLDSIQNTLNSLSLGEGWVQGKRDLKNLFIRPMELTLLPKELIPIYDKLSEDCYLLLTKTPLTGKDWAFKTDKKIPPLKKTFGKADPHEACKPETRFKCKVAELCAKTAICVKERTKFCKTKTAPLSPEALKNFLQLVLPDFPDLDPSFTDLLIINKYTITELRLPEDKDSLTSKELREKIKKVGFIERIVYLDNEFHSNKVEFTV